MSPLLRAAEIIESLIELSETPLLRASFARALRFCELLKLGTVIPHKLEESGPPRQRNTALLPNPSRARSIVRERKTEVPTPQA